MPVHRYPAPAEVSDLVRWFWIPEWSLGAGQTVRQQLLTYPACNLVVEPDLVGLHGPGTKVSHRDLTGSGWAVGALLRPAGTAAFVADAREMPDRSSPVEAPRLHAETVAVMTSARSREERHAAARELFASWLRDRAGRPSPDALLANRIADLIDQDPGIVRVSDVTSQLNVSERTLHRLTGRYIGSTPAAMIRRRRLQEAAALVRERPDTSLAQIAADLGYADHAHLAREFRDVLGFSPSEHRTSA